MPIPYANTLCQYPMPIPINQAHRLIHSYNISYKYIMQLTADQLGTLITLSAAAAGSIIVIVVNCITNSRCTDISCCWNCFHCIRALPEPDHDQPVPNDPPDP